MFERVKGRIQWAELSLPDKVVRELRALVERARARRASGDAASPGVTALFVGPRGAGRTLAAQVVATALKRPLYRVDLSQVVSKYIGETEKNLGRVFEAAAEDEAVLFFDEADALFGKRSDVRDAHDRYASVEVSYPLQRLDRFRGVGIVATARLPRHARAQFRSVEFIIRFPRRRRARLTRSGRPIRPR